MLNFPSSSWVMTMRNTFSLQCYTMFELTKSRRRIKKGFNEANQPVYRLGANETIATDNFPIRGILLSKCNQYYFETRRVIWLFASSSFHTTRLPNTVNCQSFFFLLPSVISTNSQIDKVTSFLFVPMISERSCSLFSTVSGKKWHSLCKGLKPSLRQRI